MCVEKTKGINKRRVKSALLLKRDNKFVIQWIMILLLSAMVHSLWILCVTKRREWEIKKKIKEEEKGRKETMKIETIYYLYSTSKRKHYFLPFL